MSGKLKSVLKSVYYFGTRYKCTYCGSMLRKFNPIGLNLPILKEMQIVGGYRREEGRCPICRTSDRERLLYKYVFKSGKINLKGIRVLHVAPEKNIETVFRKLVATNKIEYYSGDKFPDVYNYHNVPELDITATNFSDNYFDLLLCNHVLEHIPNDIDAMKEIFRILKPGGKAILQVPVSKVLEKTYEDFSITEPTEREEKFGQYDHVRIYGQDYTDRLASSGFKVILENPVNMFGDKVIDKEGINKEEIIFVAQKPV